MNSCSSQISIIVPVYNGYKWIRQCFESILSQTAIGHLNFEVCVCNDASTDESLSLLHIWQEKFNAVGIQFKIYSNESGVPGGVGYAKNQAVSLSSGEYLCFQDIDDVMCPTRILKQYGKAVDSDPYTIIGCHFRREPEGSMVRFTKWANALSQRQLNLQIFTSNGPTVIMPTWFCHRKVFERIGAFKTGEGVPEDLIFFYKHLDLGGTIARVDDCLLIYYYHLNQTTFQINKDVIWNLRVERVERCILAEWKKFTIWNAGKQGRKFYKSLSEENQNKVKAFCDVDKHKIGKKYNHYDTINRKILKEIDIVHFKDADPPYVICVKLDLTKGQFEKNLEELHLEEGTDYIMFS